MNDRGFEKEKIAEIGHPRIHIYNSSEKSYVKVKIPNLNLGYSYHLSLGLWYIQIF